MGEARVESASIVDLPEAARRLKGLLREALGLWHERRDGPVPDFADRASRLGRTITEHLRDRALADPNNQR